MNYRIHGYINSRINGMKRGRGGCSSRRPRWSPRTPWTLGRTGTPTTPWEEQAPPFDPMGRTCIPSWPLWKDRHPIWPLWKNGHPHLTSLEGQALPGDPLGRTGTSNALGVTVLPKVRLHLYRGTNLVLIPNTRAPEEGSEAQWKLQWIAFKKFCINYFIEKM